jgi:hypothetical protein
MTSSLPSHCADSVTWLANSGWHMEMSNRAATLCSLFMNLLSLFLFDPVQRKPNVHFPDQMFYSAEKFSITY